MERQYYSLRSTRYRGLIHQMAPGALASGAGRQGGGACGVRRGPVPRRQVWYPQNGYYSSNINNIRVGVGGKGKEKKMGKKNPEE